MAKQDSQSSKSQSNAKYVPHQLIFGAVYIGFSCLKCHGDVFFRKLFHRYTFKQIKVHMTYHIFTNT